MAKNDLQGALDLLILKTLSQLESMHGYGIVMHLRRVSGDLIIVEEGSLYPALHRMEDKRWVKAAWGTSENNRRAKYYELTAKGRQQLTADMDDWRRYAAAVAKVLNATTKPMTV